MNQTFILKNVFSVNQLLTLLKTEWRKNSDKTPLIVTVKDKQEETTTAQRRLYFMWCGQFAKHFGSDKDEVHHDIKKRFLINIYRRDDAGYAAMCYAIAKLKKTEPEQHRAIGEQVLKMTSITEANKTQMSEFMNEFFRFAQAQGLYLTCPDDLKFSVEMAA